MDTVLQLLLLGLASIAEPIRFIGYAAAGVIARRAWYALAGGAAWAVITIVGGIALGTGFHFAPVSALAQVLGGAIAAWVVFLIARALRR